MQWKAIVGVCALLCSIASTAFAQPFNSTDVGAVGAAGHASLSGGTWTVDASGADIWGSADSFHFVHQTATGTGWVAARVDDLRNTDPFAKAGVMLRSSLDAGSATAILDIKPDGFVEFMVRPLDGIEMQYVAGVQLAFPAWLRLTFEGTTVGAWTSTDGMNWTFLHDSGARLIPTPEAGLAVTSHNNSALTTAHASFLTVAATMAPSWSTIDVGAVGAEGGATTNEGAWTVRGSGGDIWGQHDAFRYLYRLTRMNNQHAVVRVDDLSNTNTFAKAGLMLRNSLGDDAATVVLDVRPGGQIEFMMRSAAGDNMAFLGTATVTFPVWLQLNWTGPDDHSTNVVASYSTDHVTWRVVGSGPQPFTLADSYDVGVAVTSHDNTATAAAHFRGLSLLPSSYWGDDIGDTGLVGNVWWDNLQVSGPAQVEAAGRDIWGTTDSFHFVHLAIDPNPSGALFSRIDLDASHPFAKAGLMYRDGLDPSAAMVIVDLKPDGAVEFMARLCGGCPVTFINSVQIGLPAWFNLFRDGDTFTATVSDATLNNRTSLGSVTVPMERRVPGFATVSHDAAHVAHAVYDDPPR